MFCVSNIGRLSDEFYQISKIIMNNCMLLVKDHEHNMSFFRIVEVEFYVHSKSHADPYVNNNASFIKNGYWHIHNDADGYMHSLYVTIGDFHNVMGYMVIRSITDHNKRLIEGPYNVLKYVNSISDVSEIHDKIFCDEGLNIRIIVIRSPYKTRISMSPRVDLSLSNVKSTGDERFMYIMRPYRFTTIPHRLQSYKHILFLSILAEGKIAFDDLYHLFNIDQKVANEWITGFNKGRMDTTCKEFLTMNKSKLNTIRIQCQAYGLMG